jgi:thioredoxin-like negative regulator of GroEL
MSLFPTSPPDAAVLLVLLPLGAGAATTATLAALQQQLGGAVRVLAIGEATHPAVVRSFGPPALPACVLVRQGVELWRQPGLPTADALAGLLHMARQEVSRAQTLV